MYVCMYVCMYVSMCVRICECMYACMYVCMKVYMYVCLLACVYLVHNDDMIDITDEELPIHIFILCKYVFIHTNKYL